MNTNKHIMETIGKQISYLEMVKQFHEAFGLPVYYNPNQVSNEDFELRINLLEEELNELKDAKNGDLNEIKENVLDALCDLQYVLSGAILQLGFKEVFNEAFTAVHKSNMSKVFKYENEKQLEDEINYLRENYGWYTFEIVTAGKNKSIIRRLSDGKILKPSGYSPVNLTPFIDLLDNS